MSIRILEVGQQDSESNGFHTGMIKRLQPVMQLEENSSCCELEMDQVDFPDYSKSTESIPYLEAAKHDRMNTLVTFEPECLNNLEIHSKNVTSSCLSSDSHYREDDLAKSSEDLLKFEEQTTNDLSPGGLVNSRSRTLEEIGEESEDREKHSYKSRRSKRSSSLEQSPKNRQHKSTYHQTGQNFTRKANDKLSLPNLVKAGLKLSNEEHSLSKTIHSAEECTERTPNWGTLSNSLGPTVIRPVKGQIVQQQHQVLKSPEIHEHSFRDIPDLTMNEGKATVAPKSPTRKLGLAFLSQIEPLTPKQKPATPSESGNSGKHSAREGSSSPFIISCDRTEVNKQVFIQSVPLAFDTLADRPLELAETIPVGNSPGNQAVPQEQDNIFFIVQESSIKQDDRVGMYSTRQLRCQSRETIGDSSNKVGPALSDSLNSSSSFMSMKLESSIFGSNMRKPQVCFSSLADKHLNVQECQVVPPKAAISCSNMPRRRENSQTLSQELFAEYVTPKQPSLQERETSRGIQLGTGEKRLNRKSTKSQSGLQVRSQLASLVAGSPLQQTNRYPTVSSEHPAADRMSLVYFLVLVGLGLVAIEFLC